MCLPLLVVFIFIDGIAQGQFKGDNIALNKPATQNPGNYCESICFPAKLAVDGLLDNTTQLQGHCTHTAVQTDNKASWTVDFTKPYHITGIIVYNRIGDLSFGRRLRDFSVYGINTEQSSDLLIYTYNYTFNSKDYETVVKIPLPTIPFVSGIKIEIPKRSENEKTILTLCEVKVFSDLSCPTLQLNNGLEVSYTNSTNNGSIASFTCIDGYEFSESWSLICQGWEWDLQPPTCEKVHCPFPIELPNGNYTMLESCNTSHDKYLPFNCSIKAHCRTGYNLKEGEIRRCLSSKNWSTPIPMCEIVKCNLPNVPNGKYVFSDESAINEITVDYGAEIRVICDTGYNLSYNHNRRCQQNETLSEKAIECNLVTCDHPGVDAISNGNYTDESGNIYISGIMNFSDTIKVLCGTGQTIGSGSSTRICQDDGTWSGTNSTCRKSNDIHSSSKSLSWIGIVVGSVTGLLVVIVSVLLILKRRGLLWWKSKQDNTIRFNDLQENENTSKCKGPTHTDHNPQPVESLSTYYDFGDLTSDKYPVTAIQINDLSNLVFSDKPVSERFEEQFKKLPKGMQGKYCEALKPHNKGKNRYKGLYAYDNSRVVLDIDSENEQDYINACYVNGFIKNKSYIASQGPTKEILTDFWRMVWQTRCRKIVMLTNIEELGKPKCVQYWPDEDSDIYYGKMMVKMIGAEMFSDFIIRKFTIKKGREDEREIIQYHYTAWPDKDVPKYASSLVQFRNKVKCDEKPDEGPLLVHCSAGVGRTGTFIALDYLTDFAKTMNFVDVFGCVKTLRQQRVNLVQTVEQYIFLHHALVETLMLSSSALSSSQFEIVYRNLLEIDEKTKRRKLEQEFEILGKLSPETVEDQYVSARVVRNRNKNRYSNILPVEEFIPKLAPGNSKEDEYVNAVFLPSYKEKMAFIITQTPLETTREDFWKLVWEYNIHTIVMMNNISEMLETEIYWPMGNADAQFGNINVTLDNTMMSDQHTVLTLTVRSFSLTRQIKLIQFGGWKSGDRLPESPRVVLSLLELVLSCQRATGNQTILAHCMNGAEKSGLFCVIYSVIDRMKVEQDVAISHTIEEMRNARQQIIPNVEQFKFCHDALLSYIQMNETYSNFTI